MRDWNASHYLKYADDRTRPAFDLVARLDLESPRTIVDLGCGTGNSTQVLHSRWPQAEVCGIDNSPAMLEVARRDYPRQSWRLAEIVDWSAEQPYDLVFSNAALHWLPNHDRLVQHLLSQVADGGALAFQIPSRTYPEVRQHIHDIALAPAWAERMVAPRSALTMEAPSFYYDVLSSGTTKLDIWETEYGLVMQDRAAIVDWIASTGLRPFLEVLEEHEQQTFLAMLQARVDSSYPIRSDGKVLFPFRRLFVIAYR